MKKLLKSTLKKFRARWHNDIEEKQNNLSAGIGGLYVKADDTHNEIGSLHAKVDECISYIQNLSHSQDDFVFVSWGVINWHSNFKKYFLANNMPEKIALLKNNLDKASKDNIDLYLERMLYLPDGNLKNVYKLSKIYLDSLQTTEEKILKMEYVDNWAKYRADFFLSEDVFSADVFLFHHGLRFTPDKIKEYIKNKDFIDGGAWIGDGTLILNKYYDPKKIYAFELSLKNCELFDYIMKRNGVSGDKYSLIPMGLSEKKESILINDRGGQGVSALWIGDVEVYLTDLDSYVMEHDLNVGFIKADLEGYGLKALRGMVKTIRNQRPVLSLSIYHNPDEFFEMKPLLEEITNDINYRITLKRFDVSVDNTAEIALFAYPAELDEGQGEA